MPTNFMLCLNRIALVTVCTMCISVQGALFSSATLNQAIPDGNPSGFAHTLTVDGLGGSVVSVSVGLQVNGGWNGDLYAYLTHGDSLVVLLNRPGRNITSPFGYGDSGFNLTLGPSGPDIHDYQSVGSGYLTLIGNPDYAWSADGRKVDPNTVTFGSERSTSLGDYVGMNPNGGWTLFFADMSGGSVSTLVGWHLNIEAVPEPVTTALGAAAGIFVCVQFVRNLRSRRSVD
jgi:subtilisin-like proprotein convertase family protein